jgi:hypothetical protein
MLFPKTMLTQNDRTTTPKGIYPMKYAIVTLLLLTSTTLASFAQAPPAKDEAVVESAATEAIVKTPADKEVENSKQEKPDMKEQDSKKKEEKSNPEKQAKEEKTGKAEKEPKDKKPIPYPLETCIVTGNDLGSMGDPVTFIHEGREIKVCCKPCEKKFMKDPARYLANLTTE